MLIQPKEIFCPQTQVNQVKIVDVLSLGLNYILIFVSETNLENFKISNVNPKNILSPYFLYLQTIHFQKCEVGFDASHKMIQ